LGLAGIVGALTKWYQLSGPLLAALLLFPTLGFAAAPFNSWAAQRATLPAWLRERRRTENRRDRRGLAAGRAPRRGPPRVGRGVPWPGPRCCSAGAIAGGGRPTWGGPPRARARRRPAPSRRTAGHRPRRPPPRRPRRRPCRPARRSRPQPACHPRPHPPRRS